MLATVFHRRELALRADWLDCARQKSVALEQRDQHTGRVRYPEEELRLTTNELELEAAIVTAVIMSATTSEAGGGASQRTGAREIALATRTLVKVTAHLTPGWEREIMTTRFPDDPEVGASTSPFWSMRRDAPATSTRLREQMRQLVAKCTINLGGSVRAEPAIQENARATEFRASGSCAEPLRPFDAHVRGERSCTMFGQ